MFDDLTIPAILAAVQLAYGGTWEPVDIPRVEFSVERAITPTVHLRVLAEYVGSDTYRISTLLLDTPKGYRTLLHIPEGETLAECLPSKETVQSWLSDSAETFTAALTAFGD